MARRLFIRVRDKETRHEFDVYEDDPRIGSVFEHVKPVRYPPAATMRPPKYNTDLAGQTATQTPESTGAGTGTTEES